MPRFYEGSMDHRLDNQVSLKQDLRFSDQQAAEDFAIAQYRADAIPRSVIRGAGGGHFVLEDPSRQGHPHEVFHINSTPCEG